MPQVAVTGTFNVNKTDDEQHLLFGWANIAVSDGTIVTDSHDEQIAPDDLERAAYGFVLKARVSGEDHNGGLADGVLVESMMFTDQKILALAVDPFTGDTNDDLAKALDGLPRGWWVGFHVPDDEAWERAKTDKTEFSIEGTARVA